MFQLHRARMLAGKPARPFGHTQVPAQPAAGSTSSSPSSSGSGKASTAAQDAPFAKASLASARFTLETYKASNTKVSTATTVDLFSNPASITRLGASDHQAVVFIATVRAVVGKRKYPAREDRDVEKATPRHEQALQRIMRRLPRDIAALLQDPRHIAVWRFGILEVAYLYVMPANAHYRSAGTRGPSEQLHDEARRGSHQQRPGSHKHIRHHQNHQHKHKHKHMRDEHDSDCDTHRQKHSSGSRSRKRQRGGVLFPQQPPSAAPMPGDTMDRHRGGGAGAAAGGSLLAPVHGAAWSIQQPAVEVTASQQELDLAAALCSLDGVGSAQEFLRQQQLAMHLATAKAQLGSGFPGQHQPHGFQPIQQHHHFHHHHTVLGSDMHRATTASFVEDRARADRVAIAKAAAERAASAKAEVAKAAEAAIAAAARKARMEELLDLACSHVRGKRQRRAYRIVMRRRLTMELQRGLRFETLKRRLENGETFDEQ